MTFVRVQTEPSGEKRKGPAAFTLGEREFRVQQVLDRWDGSDHTYFRVIAEDDIIYILRHDIETGQWEVTTMDAFSGTC